MFKQSEVVTFEAHVRLQGNNMQHMFTQLFRNDFLMGTRKKTDSRQPVVCSNDDI